MGGLTLPEARALERNKTPLQGTMIFLQRKINTLPQGFTPSRTELFSFLKPVRGNGPPSPAYVIL
jgi:hypothetical protein